MSCEAHGLAESRKEIDGDTVDLLRRLAEDLPTGGTVVDLGTGSGTTLLSILGERNDAIHIHTYDLDVQWGQAVVNNERVNRVGDVTFYRGDIFADEVPFRGEHGVDLLLVDLLPERTEEILVRWLPMLNPRARVWVHNADQEHVAAVLQTLVSEEDFPIETIDKRGRSWVGGVKEITLGRKDQDEGGTEDDEASEGEGGEGADVDSESRHAEEDAAAQITDPPVTDDESGPDPKTGVESADPKEEVPPSPPKQPKRAPSKRSRKSSE